MANNKYYVKWEECEPPHPRDRPFFYEVYTFFDNFLTLETIYFDRITDLFWLCKGVEGDVSCKWMVGQSNG